MQRTRPEVPPILRNKEYAAPSAFEPASILREARRQKGLREASVPAVCVLDPDGDMVRHLKQAGARRDAGWACYHTELYRTGDGELELGVLPFAVGAPFAVLVAEQLFESGCRLLVSITSSGQLIELREPPYFVLIEKALRDEGTSYHYLPAAEFSSIEASLLKALREDLAGLPVPVECGDTWTTDGPFRETAGAIAAMRNKGLLAVEMEAAALYAFGQARQKPVLCFAHVTNRMGAIAGDFEKGEADGALASLALAAAAARLVSRSGIVSFT
jgi:uridine phosphorylase